MRAYNLRLPRHPPQFYASATYRDETRRGRVEILDGGVPVASAPFYVTGGGTVNPDYDVPEALGYRPMLRTAMRQLQRVLDDGGGR